MSLFKRGSFWWIDIASPTGERIRKSSGTHQKELAQEYHDRLKSDLWKQSKLKEKPSRTWEEAADRWLADREDKPNAQNNAQYIAWLLKYLKGKPLAAIDKDLIDSLAAKKSGEGVSVQTVNHYMKTLRAILRAAWEWGWLDTVPAIRLQKIEQKRLRFLTRKEAEQLLLALPPHMKAIVSFALVTGLRQRNILTLEWNQVDMYRRILWIHADQSKSRKTIRVPLNQDALDILRNQMGKHEVRVFTYKGRPVETIGDSFDKAVRRVGIKDFRFHDLRHTWASWHIQSGTPIAVLQELGGWSSLSMVMRYAHLSDHHLSEWAERVNVTNTTHSHLKIVE